MNIHLVGIIGVFILLLLFFIKVPIGFAMAMVGFLGICIVKGIGSGLSNIAIIPIRWASTYILCAIPLFILMGYLAANVGLTRDAFTAANKWLGHIRGGLAISCVIACAAFGAVCGDVIAAAVSMSAIALPDMRKHYYKDELSLGSIAAGGNLSFLIPPSVGFITYGLLTTVSIGQLFIAGILPGILLSLLFIIAILIQCYINPSLASKGLKVKWKERIASTKLIWGFVLLILLVLGGIYGGVFTPTEAAAVGVFGCLILGLVKRRLNWQVLSNSMKVTAHLTGMIFMLIAGAMIFNTFLTVSEISLAVANFIIKLPVSPWLILGAVLLFFVAVGFVLDVMAVIMLAVPILHPVLVNLGFDPVWLGVIIMMTIIMGHISPPFGIVVFALGGVVKDVPLFKIFHGALPFLAAMFVCLVMLLAVPEIATFLPNLMK